MGQVGSVVSLAGKVVAVLDGAERVLSAGSSIFEGEIIKTGAGANIEVKFDDETVMSQGPGSELTIDSYVYNPNAPAQSSFLFKMAQGTYRMATGQIAEDNPDGVRLESPLATIGIRGTTTISQILPNGQELHAAESLTGGRSILIADQFGNQQLISFPSGGVPMGPGQPMGAVFTVPQNVFDAIKASAPLTTNGEPPAPGSQGGDTPPDTGGDQGTGEDPGAGELAANGDVPPDGAAGDGTGDGAGDGTGEITGDAVAGGEDPLGGAGDGGPLGGVDGDTGIGGGLGGGTIGLIGGDPSQEFLGGGSSFLNGAGENGPDAGSGGQSNQGLLDNFLNNSGGDSGGDSGGTTDGDNPFDTTDDTVPGDNGDATVIELGGITIVLGTEGDDTMLLGTNGDDLIYGLGGNDVLVGLGSDTLGDLLNGGEGYNDIYGGNYGDVYLLGERGTVSHNGDSLDDGAAADISGNGLNDVVLLAYDGSAHDDLVWYESNIDSVTGTVSFTEHAIATGINSTGSNALDVGDVNGDDAVDVVVGTPDSVILYQNLGGGTFDSGTTIVSGRQIPVQMLKFADVDNDGTVDIVVREESGGDLIWYDHSNSWAPETIASGLNTFDGFKVLELNATGSYKEVIFNSLSTLHVATYSSGAWGFDTMAAGVDKFVLADFSGDGHADLVASDSITGTLYTFYGDGSTLNAWDTLSGLPGTVKGLAAVNLNPDTLRGGDTDIDIIAATSSAVYAFINADGDGTFIKSAVPLVSGLSGIDGLEVGDYDGDGMADDVAIHFTGSNEVIIYQNLFAEAHMNTVDYSDSADSVDVNLASGYAGHGGYEDYLYLIDHAQGSDVGSDVIYGNDFNNMLSGLGGDDTITGALGDDTIFGNDGNDSLTGGMGNDLIYGGAGDDHIMGMYGSNTLYGGDDDDTIEGGAGQDLISGAAGNDLIMGGEGNDTIDGGTGNDEIWGQAGQDLITGGEGDDTIYATDDMFSGSPDYGDTLDGGAGNDHLFGTSVGDSISGGTGNDFLVGLGGADSVYGGAGSDTFYYSYANDGGDYVGDFAHGEDVFSFNASGFGNMGSNEILPSDVFFLWNDSVEQAVFNGSGSFTFASQGTTGFIYEVTDAGTSGGDLWYSDGGSNSLIAHIIQDVSGTGGNMTASDIYLDASQPFNVA